jgi:predicted ATPase/class 3 adenylate cyclase
MAELPSGTVTFLFTDLEGSTRLWEQFPEGMREALARHDEILRNAIEAHDGAVVKTTGDGVHAAFGTAHDAVGAALDAQTALSAHEWGVTGALRVRVGLHTGECQLRGGDYFGSVVNRAARIMAVAHGGQIVCSRAVVEVAGDGFPVRSLGEHRLRDLGAAQELFQVGDGSFPPLSSLDVVATNLPTVVTELIGRSQDVERVLKSLEHARLVTLTGVGGVGKTRLALAVAGASVSGFPDGVWLVELAPVSSPEEVVRATASAVGAPTVGRSDLARYLADRRALVVLDNCEHVLSEAAALAEAILAAGPEPVVIATSREPLGVEGETVRGVPSLQVPDADSDDVMAAAAAAVRLFVDRAEAATDLFELSEANLPAVVAICDQLDGIPLAIELAASRVRVMAPAEIAARLGERFRLLTGGRGAQERHRTLQATVAWSHDLLTIAEQRVFRRLAAFPGSFDLAAADAVAGDAETDVIDALVRLVEQSLVQHDAATGRYRLLETLREYAADRLADAGETDRVFERHVTWYTRLAAEGVSLREFPSATTIQRLATEMDNLQAAAEWLVSRERWTSLLELARHLFGYGFVISPINAGIWYRTALKHAADIDLQIRVDALGELSYLDYGGGFMSASDAAESSIALADQAALLHSPWAWNSRVLSALARADAATMKTAIEPIVGIAKERDDEIAVLFALGMAAVVPALEGDYAQSTKLADEALRRARAIANPAAVTMVAALVGGGYLTIGVNPDFAGGIAFLEANPVDPDANTPTSTLWVNFEWGIGLLGEGRLPEAVTPLIRAMRLADSTFPSAQSDVLRALAVALGEAGHADLAIQLDGYAQTNFAAHPPLNPTHIWLEPRLTAIEQHLDDTERAAALATGAALDRRAFMRLLAEAEDRIATRTPP